MLAQNFKSATDLGITEPQLSALIKVCGMLERRELVHSKGLENPNGFNMANGFAQAECGTIGCIAGWADSITRSPSESLLHKSWSPALYNLFVGGSDPYAVTIDQAAIALRSYLTTGDAKWHEAVA